MKFADAVLVIVTVRTTKDMEMIRPHHYFEIGDLIFDVDLGVGIIKQVYADADIDGIVYYVWWVSSDEHTFEYPEDLFGLGLG